MEGIHPNNREGENNRVKKDSKKRKPKRVHKELTLEGNDRAIIGDKIVSIRPLRGRASRFRIRVEDLQPEDSGTD